MKGDRQQNIHTLPICSWLEYKLRTPQLQKIMRIFPPSTLINSSFKNSTNAGGADLFNHAPFKTCLSQSSSCLGKNQVNYIEEVHFYGTTAQVVYQFPHKYWQCCSPFYRVCATKASKARQRAFFIPKASSIK